MPLISPLKTSRKEISIKHWQRIWIEKHSSINLSGLVQEMLIEIIKAHDPEYFKAHQKYLDIPATRKKEIIDQIVSTTPIISKANT